jgi:hypothetical protein
MAVPGMVCGALQAAAPGREASRTPPGPIRCSRRPATAPRLRAPQPRRSIATRGSHAWPGSGDEGDAVRTHSPPARWTDVMGGGASCDRLRPADHRPSPGAPAGDHDRGESALMPTTAAAGAVTVAGASHAGPAAASPAKASAPVAAADAADHAEGSHGDLDDGRHGLHGGGGRVKRSRRATSRPHGWVRTASRRIFDVRLLAPSVDPRADRSRRAPTAERCHRQPCHARVTQRHRARPRACPCGSGGDRVSP